MPSREPPARGATTGRSAAEASRASKRAAFPAPLGASTTAAETYDLSLLAHSHTRWRSSPGLRAVYGDIYRAMAALAAPGAALEIGSGAGTITDFLPDVITSDIRLTPFVACTASAYALEATPGGPWSTIYALDVLHHLQQPFRFFASAAAALRPGGRIVICDPAASMWGRIFFRLFHREPIRAHRLQAPYAFSPDSARGEFANMAMAWALFVRDAQATRDRLATAGLTLQAPQFRDVIAYAASGGFSGPRLLPAAGVRALLAAERALPQALLRKLALRMIVVLEKTSA